MHDRSITPEKLWDDFYLEFPDELKSRGAWLPTAAGINHPRSYFERCLCEFLVEPHLGIGGGVVCVRAKGKTKAESKDPAFRVRESTKIYRRECWHQIGGLIRAPGWDTYDEVKANMLGWKTRTFNKIELVHHRPTGGA